MTVKDRRSKPRRSISSANEVEVRKYVLSSRMTFQEVLLIRICTANVHDKAGKYPRKSYCHRIKCSVTNSLTALIGKWYLNNNFQPYSYFQRLQEGADMTEIGINNLIYTWRAKIKKGGEYKIRRNPWEKGIEKLRETL